MSNTFDKLSVLDSFIEEVNSYLPEIESNLDRLTYSPGDMDALEETYRRSHTIGGSASMMDFPGLAHVAHGMEDILGDALDGLTTLDESTIGLLRRSLGRLHRLLEGIRSGVDEESIIAEDDADYASYRARVEASLQSSQGVNAAPPIQEAQMPGMVPPSTPQYFEPASSVPSSVPSFEEVLDSFLTPSVTSGEEVSWPEDSNALHPVEESEQYASSFYSQPYPEPDKASLSAWDELVASTRSASSSLSPAPQITGYEATTSPEVRNQETTDVSQSSIEEIPTAQWSQTQEVTPSAPVPFYESPTITQPQQSAETVRPSYEQQVSSDPLWPAIPSSQQSLYDAQNSSQSQVQEPVVQPTVEASRQSSPSYQVQVPASEQQPVYEPNNTYTNETEPFYQHTALDRYEVKEPVSQYTNEALSTLPAPYHDLQKEAQTIEDQASVLKNIIIQLREAMSVIEVQRSEFKSFLDGSKDALDRMEDWAGVAMGLNLRNSPEQVRRYLPLSVMWVANSKLKKVLDQVHQITGGVETTDEQLSTALLQLHSSLHSFGEAFTQQMQSSARLSQGTGWSPWEMQVAQNADGVRERVTFERRGDTAAVRAELEQQIREELRQEFEEKQRLQERAATPLNGISLKEIEARLRSEIEIQVRREFLSQLTQENAGAVSSQQEKRNLTTTSNTVSQITPTPVEPVRTPPAPAPMKPAASSPMTEFGEEAVEIFRAEAEEHLQTISINVAALEKDAGNRELIQGVRRATHTLKGAAGMMGFRAIADLCHVSEDLLDSIMESTTAITPAVLSIIFDTAEALDVLITGRNPDGLSDEARVQGLRARYTELLGEQGMPSGLALDYLDVMEDDHLEDVALTTGVVTEEQGSGIGLQKGVREELTVRVRLPKLDELVNLFGELLVNRSVLEERVQRLNRLIADVGVSSNRLREVGQKLESRFEAVMLPSGRSVQVMPGEGDHSLLRNNMNNNEADRAHLAEFDELELDRYTEFHQLARGLSEGISDMATLSTEMDTVIRECEGIISRENRLNTSFQDRLMKVRLVPLSNMTPRLYRAAYSVALKQHKEIDFQFEGDATEVDRTVFEEISGPLLHLIRNAVNHAIEVPESRMKRGKPSAGLVKVSASYEGSQIVITVRDDGTGIDTEGVRRTAIARGMIRADQSFTESDLIDLIFRPGFSTASHLSEESGRGVGLDVVRDSVSRLRGTLVVESTPGQGTAFTMTFPTSLAIQTVMMIAVGGQQFAVPTAAVEAIGRLDNFKRSIVSGQPAVIVQNDLYPLHLLAQYLSLQAKHLDDKAQLLLINASGRHIALVVDEIKGKADIVMKNLGPHLRHVHGIAGGTVLGNGHVVLVLELNDLLNSNTMNALMQSRQDVAASSGPNSVRQQVETSLNRQRPTAIPPSSSRPVTPERGKHILVVDDSPSVRRVVSGMLKQHGWEVQTARDGVEASEMISAETPAAVLLDIEMPRMDGYELISTIRAQGQYSKLPLVVLTSRAAAKHQQRAMMLGASAYVIKPYQDEELINILNTLVYGAGVR